MNRATAVAPANIAFTKFWGWRDETLTLPHHDTISMTLSNCLSRTTVIERAGGAAARGDAADEIVLLDEHGGETATPESFRRRVREHLDFLRSLAASGETGAPGRRGGGPGFRVVTMNSMPMGTGIASSASGFAALTVAVAAVLGLDAPERQLSIWARRSGSGSASRSIPGGFVRWYAGSREDGEDGYAESLHGPEHWALADTIAIVDTSPKAVASREGHRAASTSPYFTPRLVVMTSRNARVAAAIAARDLDALGVVLEEEALDLHRIAETSAWPRMAAPVSYRTAGTSRVLECVAALRRDGVGAWFTLDAGPNVHVMSRAEDAPAVEQALAALDVVKETRVNRPAPGAALVTEHLVTEHLS